MSMIPEETIEQVRDSADLVTIIGATVDLKRSGSDYRGPCPFHGGQHRNFAVIPRKNRYYCFVCKASGDVFSWYMNRVGLDWPSAVREVARSLGIQIPEQGARQGPDPREPYFQAIAAAHDWFIRQLIESPEAQHARNYLAGRAIEPEQVELLELGYAPKSTAFMVEMSRLGLNEKTLLEAGLLAERHDGKIIPRFRDRLLFPIHDIRGKTVGFGGRLLGPGEPKYLNSPESPVFHKGGTLYNLHAARQAIRKEEQVIIVEGYFDVIRLVLAGCENVVAPLGTALTPEQAALLKRYAATAVLLLDSDSAGLKATFRAGDELLRHQVRVRVATMPDGEDPDTLVRATGMAGLQEVLRDAVDLLERKIQILDRRGFFADLEHRREALDRLLPTIRATSDPIQKELYLSRVAERTGVSKTVLEQEAANQPARAPQRSPDGAEPPSRRVAEPGAGGTAQPPAVQRSALSPSEKHVLRLMIASDEWRSRAGEVVQADWFDHQASRELFDLLRTIREAGQVTPPDDLSGLPARLWRALLQLPVPDDFRTQANDFAGASRRLEARQHFRSYYRLSDRVAAASDEERTALNQEKAQVRADLETRFPEEWRLEGYRRRRTRRSSRSI
jgi:DNA primase